MENNHKNQTTDELYLNKLEFKPELRKTWLNFFVTNFRVVILMIVLLTMWGVYSFATLPRESNPEVKIPIAIISTVYPGVAPADIEELVTKKIETGISSVKGIKKITSNSANSASIISVEFNANEDLVDSIRRLRDQVTSIKNELPLDAKDPIVKEVSFDDTPVWSVEITGPYDGFTLRKYTDQLRDEIEKISGVREVIVSGGDVAEISVAYDPDKLGLYNVTTDQANGAIKSRNVAIPAGNFDGEKYVYAVRTDSKFFTAQELAETPIGHADDGTLILLKDVAVVKEQAIKKTTITRNSIKGSKPEASVSLNIIKKTGGNVLDTVDQAQKVIESELTKYPPGIKYSVSIDYAKQIRKDFDQLTHDFIVTIILVMLLLFVIVGLKEALVAGLAVPLVFFVTFGMLKYFGISLNFLSVFSLLLSLGLLVDDAIVVVSATKQYLKTGKFTPEEAVLLVLNDFKIVLTTTTLTTVWAFLPLLQATGIIGSFIKSIPITVSIILVSSLLVALMINHPLAAVLERIRLTRRLFFTILASIFSLAIYLVLTGSLLIILLALPLILLIIWLLNWYLGSGKSKLIANEALMGAEWKSDELIKLKLRRQGQRHEGDLMSKLIHGVANFEMVLPIYEKYLRLAIGTKKMRRLILSAVAGLFVLAIAMPVLGVVPTEFFPASNADLIFVNMQAPTGLKIEETSKIITEAEKKLLNYPEIESFSTIIGSGGVNLNSAGNTGSGGSNLGAITINLIPNDKRSFKSYDFATKLRDDFEHINGATFTVDSPRGGPPSGSAFEARIVGTDLAVLDKMAHDLEPILKSTKGITSTDISLKASPAEYTFTLDPKKMELYGLNSAYVGSVLRLAISGSEITTVVRGGDEVKVIAKFETEKIPDLKSIQDLQILNLRKQSVYIKDVAKIELRPSVNAITRIDQKRSVLLSGGVDATARPADVLKAFQKSVADGYKIPTGYNIVYGGENEQNNESVLSIIRAMFVAALLIISTLIIQFNSFKKAVIVLVTIPLALIGVFLGMAVTQIPLSFPGLIGILALFGIVVKNAIILIDKINLNLKSDIAFEEAIVDAGKSRLEAIVITSICTIAGLVPITLANETWTALGSAVIFGLLLSSFLTLFIVPTLFVSFVNKE
ncbi:MAG: efflux RND transporter permease subunit [bacterium]